MAKGVVKWYDRQRGEGFIQRFEGPDVHVPGNALLDREPGFLIEGQAVEFELLTIPGGFRARRVRVVDPRTAASPHSKRIR
ncbi:MAG: cold shock domain-containing protein [Acidobacteria bacterium]|nr:cold shock domain-containing protein [Acidobacteriota bacterium]MYG74072.1 cold shock domain-containing protein [Acidobacteriota bacterium]